MKTILLSLLLFLSYNGNSQIPYSNTQKIDTIKEIEDRKIIGIVKIYKLDKTIEAVVTYYDEKTIQHPVQIFDMIARLYLLNFPILDHMAFFQILNDNTDRYLEYYFPNGLRDE